MSGKRKASFLHGVEAEWLAAAFLRLKGYRILAKRYVAAGGEVDLVAARFGTIAFVEVKARRTMDEARVSITADKRRRVGRAARAFLSRYRGKVGAVRLDAVYLAPGRLPVHETAIGEIGMD